MVLFAGNIVCEDTSKVGFGEIANKGRSTLKISTLLMRFFKTNWLVKKYFSEFIWDKFSEEKKIYLTFDDGPIPELTEFVLDTLEQFEAKATFFCVGDNIQKHPDIFEKIIRQNHTIGNHTFNHLKGWQSKDEDYLKNIEMCQAMIEQYLPYQTENYFRPPYGKIKSTQFQGIKSSYKIVMWDVLTYDFDQKLAKEICLKKAIESTQSGSILVFHDNIKAKQNLQYVLPRFLEHFSQLEFGFENL